MIVVVSEKKILVPQSSAVVAWYVMWSSKRIGARGPYLWWMMSDSVRARRHDCQCSRGSSPEPMLDLARLATCPWVPDTWLWSMMMMMRMIVVIVGLDLLLLSESGVRRDRLDESPGLQSYRPNRRRPIVRPEFLE